MKNIFRISGVILLIILIHSCKKDRPTPPIVITTAVTAISYTTATSGGEVTNEGGSPVTERGICWNTSVDPTISNNKTTASGGLGVFTSNLTQLTPNTLYYVRAYATNIAGTSYGSHVTFTSLQIAAPVLTTAVITSITQTTAVSGGNITADNGGSVTARGVCWGTATNPTIALSTKTGDGTGTGSFVSNLINLQPGTIYYVRSYATNSLGTSYGNEISFTTLQPPTATTAAATSLASTTATLNGTVNANNQSTTVTFEYGTTTSYGQTINAIPNTVSGSTNTGVSANLTGLTANTTYHFRVKAVSSVGTTYGSDVTFTTLGNIIFNPDLTYGSVSDNDGNTYKTILIGTQTWMAENLKTTKYNDGTAIPLVTDGTAWAALSTPGYCWYNNDAATYKATYGAIYNWYTVNTGKLCPTGWHVPSDAEWTTLITFLGGESIAGGKMKESGTSHWLSPNTGATNSSGFTALPGGQRWDYDGKFSGVGNFGEWWSSTSRDVIYVFYYNLYYNYPDVGIGYLNKPYGFSVRCLIGGGQIIPTVTTNAASTITSTSATVGGNVTADGGAPVSERGIYWSTSQYPESTGTKLQIGSGTGSFSASLLGLNPNTTYYVKAYATNSSGTAYGNGISFTTLDAVLAIGQSYQGGVIAYILQSGDHGYVAGETHGLIAAPSDQDQAPWGCYGTVITGADGTAIGTGNQNTIDIMNGCSTAGIAARLCGDLVLGGYSDWYLPSKDELNKLYLNKAAIRGFSNSNNYYWSSSEASNNYVWIQYFSTGYQDPFHKGDHNAVRAVRAF